jgi:hypothetical protein
MMVLQLLHSKTAGEPPHAFIQHTSESTSRSWQRQTVICCTCMRGIRTTGQQDPCTLAHNPCTAHLNTVQCSDRCKMSAVCADAEVDH